MFQLLLCLFMIIFKQIKFWNNNTNKKKTITFHHFVFSFKNRDDGSTTNFFVEYYMLLVEIKDFNALIENKLSLHEKPCFPSPGIS